MRKSLVTFCMSVIILSGSIAVFARSGYSAAQDEMKKDDMKTGDMNHDGMKHHGTKHRGMKHDGMNHEGMKHDGMKHDRMNHEGMKHDGMNGEMKGDSDMNMGKHSKHAKRMKKGTMTNGEMHDGMKKADTKY